MFKKKKSKNKAQVGEGLGSFLLAVLAILAFRWALFEPYVIPSGSMIPTLLIHDHILVSKFTYGIRIPFTKKWIFEGRDPKHGDIVVFRSVEDGGYFMIKRVVGLPGDRIEIDSEGHVILNGEKLPETKLAVNEDKASQAPYYPVKESDIDGRFLDFEFFEEDLKGVKHRKIQARGAGHRLFGMSHAIPERHYFVMGDNRDNSKDSRYWSTLPRENLLGQAQFVWLSCEETLPLLSFICNPLKLRWGRFFQTIE